MDTLLTALSSLLLGISLALLMGCSTIPQSPQPIVNYCGAPYDSGTPLGTCAPTIAD